MNRRQFLQTIVIIPVSAALVTLTKKLHANSPCENCLPKLLYNRSQIQEPTGIELESFHAEPFSFMDFIRSIFSK